MQLTPLQESLLARIGALPPSFSYDYQTAPSAPVGKIGRGARPREQVVRCLETRTEYLSSKAAAAALNIFRSGIVNAINTGKPYRGQHWEYAT